MITANLAGWDTLLASAQVQEMLLISYIWWKKVGERKKKCFRKKLSEVLEKVKTLSLQKRGESGSYDTHRCVRTASGM